MELIDLMDSIKPQMNLIRWLNILPGSLTVTLTVLLFWIHLILLVLVFVLQWLSIHWEILIMLLFQFPLTFQQTENKIPRFNILVLIGMVFVVTFHGRISLNSVFLLLVKFVSGFRLEFMYVSLIIGIKSNLTHLYGFQQPVLLP